jgi:hypothetical protein
MNDDDFIENEEFQFEKLIDEFLDKRNQQYKLSLELKQVMKRIYYLKKKFRNTEPEEFDFEKGTVKLKKFISKFSSILSKDFQKLSNEEKRKMFKTGLLSLRFKLNPYKYQKIKDTNKETPIDKYVEERKRTNEFYLNTNWSDDNKSEIDNFKKDLKEKWEIWDSEVFNEEKFMKELIEDEDEDETEDDEEYYREIIEETSPDPIYFTDDDPADLEENIEYIEKGFLHPTISDDHPIISDEENKQELKEIAEEKKYFNQKDREEKVKEKKFELLELKKKQLNKIKKETDKLEKAIKEEEEEIKKDNIDDDDMIPW